jgi:hypothetical protein
MSTCYDPGMLRAYLDDELPDPEHAGVDAHLGDCARCSAELDELGALDRETRARLAAGDGPAPRLEPAFARVSARLATVRPAGGAARGRRAAGRRPLLGGVAAAAALLLLLLVPQVRAAASQLLQIFRAQSVVYVSVPANRVQQLENLQGQQGALFLSKPQEVGTPPAPQSVGSATQAAALLGFTPLAPTAFPATPTTSSIAVEGQVTYRMQVNVATIRQLLATLGVTDVTIPDALGSRPISIVLPPSAELQFQGADYTVTLIEGLSPTVALPPGVDLAQMGTAALEVYGMSHQQAVALSRQIDWNTTLVFPFPLGTNQIEQVGVRGTHGVLLNVNQDGALPFEQSNAAQVPHTAPANANPDGTGQTANPGGGPSTVLFWQEGSRFYILMGQGHGLGDAAMLSVANSLR